jgi:RNA polymerase sigma factor (sigma-70 family)
MILKGSSRVVACASGGIAGGIMGFPQTRMTLVQRLASGGAEEDWQGFLKDYWGPICRFAMRYGARNLDEAEDVASETFEALWKQRLLVRWASNRSAKLRTLLCCVVRNIHSHRNRVRASREQRLQDVVDHVNQLNPTPDEHVDAFYAAWVEDVVQQAVESLASDYCRKGQGDYVRVLYGRLCQGMTIAQAAEALKISPTAVDHYFRHAKERLSENLKQLTRRQVLCYSPAEESEEEFAIEWQRLGHYLAENGGLDEAVRRAYDLFNPVQAKSYKEIGLKNALTRLTTIIRSSIPAPLEKEPG